MSAVATEKTGIDGVTASVDSLSENAKEAGKYVGDRIDSFGRSIESAGLSVKNGLLGIRNGLMCVGLAVVLAAWPFAIVLAAWLFGSAKAEGVMVMSAGAVDRDYLPLYRLDDWKNKSHNHHHHHRPKAMSQASGLKLWSFQILDDVTERTPCQTCKGVSRRYFCYTCCTPVPVLIGRLPRVKLPVNIDIIRHPKEKHGKSTGVQCAILAPENVRLFMYPDFPDYRKEKVILIFPDPSTVTLSQLIAPSTSSSDSDRLETFQRKIREATRFVFIDCTWFQVGGMRKHDHFESIPTLALEGRHTRYWRPQHNEPEGNLATVEAVYYFCLDYEKWKAQDGQKEEYAFDYDGQYDDLLYFFEYFRQKVECEQAARQQRRKRLADE